MGPRPHNDKDNRLMPDMPHGLLEKFDQKTRSVMGHGKQSLVLLVILLIGCSSAKTPSSATPVLAQSAIDQACGVPIRWPISRECVNLLGPPRASILQQKSDLVMA